MKRFVLLLILCLPASILAQKFAGLAPTPPMGWNSWNTFGVAVDEKLIKEMADAMIASGMQKAEMKHSAAKPRVSCENWLMRETRLQVGYCRILMNNRIGH